MRNIYTLIPKLTGEICFCLSEWYGAGAHLVSEKPAIERRHYSFILTYPIISDDGRKVAIRVKIPRRMVDDVTDQDDGFGSDSISIRDEYETLLKISQAIDAHGSQNLFAINALAYFEKWSAIVTEDMPSHRLKGLLLQPRLAIGDRRSWASLVAIFRKAGEWLRVFHDRLGKPASGEFNADVVATKVDREIDRIENASSLELNISYIRKYFESVLKDIEGQKLTFSDLHGDFASGNVLISHKGNVGSLDSNLGQRGPIFVDFGTLLADYYVIKAQIASNGMAMRYNQHRYDACVDAFLAGYFDLEEPTLATLNLFCAVAVMEKWRWNEEKIATLKRVPERIKRFMVAHIRRYYFRVLRSLLIYNQSMS